MKELLKACQKFIAQISPSGDERYYDIDPQDLKEFCDSVEAAQQGVQSDDCPLGGKHEWHTMSNGEYTKVVCGKCGNRG